MPKRSAVSLDDIASFESLSAAFWRAARHCSDRDEVRVFAARLDENLATLRADILAERVPDGRWKEFAVVDPKPRRILAPCFRDRILHHALMGQMGPVLDRALVDDTYACRVGRGTLAAVHRAQQHARSGAWFVKIDVRAYFASIDHGILLALLARRFKHPRLLALCGRILSRTPDFVGRGLPIGALTSQHFANTYLDGLDRFLLEGLRVRGMVRYMDDAIWWCDDRDRAAKTLDEVRQYLARERRLEVKPDARIGRSRDGVQFVGFRVLPWRLRLSLRRRRRYTAARRRWETRYATGEIDGLALQRGYDAALAVTAHADAVRWRRAELMRRPALDV